MPASLDAIYLKWARFVWLALQRLGVRQADLDDVCHDVFIIVQRKLPEFREGAPLNSWLFGICVRTAANYRRRAHFRLERPHGNLEGDDIRPLPLQAPPPDQQLAERQALALAEHILSKMNPVKRAVFVMFELEGLSCQDIADELGLPVGTVYSRLHAARKFFATAATRAAKGGK